MCTDLCGPSQPASRSHEGDGQEAGEEPRRKKASTKLRQCETKSRKLICSSARHHSWHTKLSRVSPTVNEINGEGPVIASQYRTRSQRWWYIASVNVCTVLTASETGLSNYRVLPEMKGDAICEWKQLN